MELNKQGQPFTKSAVVNVRDDDGIPRAEPITFGYRWSICIIQALDTGPTVDCIPIGIDETVIVDLACEPHSGLLIIWGLRNQPQTEEVHPGGLLTCYRGEGSGLLCSDNGGGRADAYPDARIDLAISHAYGRFWYQIRMSSTKETIPLFPSTPKPRALRSFIEGRTLRKLNIQFQN